MSTGAGLRCRWQEGPCEERFHSNGSVEGIAAAVVLRDAHEVGKHNYHHVVVTTWTYTARFSRKGISTLNRPK